MLRGPLVCSTPTVPVAPIQHYPIPFHQPTAGPSTANPTYYYYPYPTPFTPPLNVNGIHPPTTSHSVYNPSKYLLITHIILRSQTAFASDTSITFTYHTIGRYYCNLPP